jgi:hypothetical protein
VISASAANTVAGSAVVRTWDCPEPVSTPSATSFLVSAGVVVASDRRAPKQHQLTDRFADDRSDALLTEIALHQEQFDHRAGEPVDR